MKEGKFEAASGPSSKEWAEQQYIERCRNTIEELKTEGGRFRVERSEEVKPGIHKKEYDWKIDHVLEDEILVSKPAQKPGDRLFKNVSLKEFMAWQEQYVRELDELASNETQRRGLTDMRPVMEEIYKKNGVTPGLLKLHNLAML